MGGDIQLGFVMQDLGSTDLQNGISRSGPGMTGDIVRASHRALEVQPLVVGGSEV